MLPCSECGRPTANEAQTCTNCGHAMANGTPAKKLPPPPELSGWVLHQTPPELIEEMRRTFNEEEFLAELREVERNGGGELKDFLHELEQEVSRL